MTKYSKEEHCELLAFVLEEKPRLPSGGSVHSVCHTNDGSVPWGIDSVDDLHMTSPYIMQDGAKGLKPRASGRQVAPSALVKWVVADCRGHTSVAQ